MEPTTAAYIAGLIDGEGCFYVEKFKTTRSPIGCQYRIIVTITMCDKETIESVCKDTDKNFRVRKTLTSGGRIAYTIDWRNTIAYNFIKLILPYLRGKKEQAELCILFNETLAPGRGKTYTQEHASQCESIRLKLQELKKPNVLRC